MAKRSPFVEFFLRLINSIFTLSGLVTVSYALYCLLKLKASKLPDHSHKKQKIARVLLESNISEWLSYKLPEAWFVYLLLVVGASLIVISCFGFAGTATRSPCCLCFYSVLLAALSVAQLGAAAFMFFHHNWKQDVPDDKSGSFHLTYHFFQKNWKIIQWVALGALILEGIAIALALYLRYLSRVSNETCYERQVVYPGRVRPTAEKRRNPASAATSPAATSPAAISPGGKQEMRTISPIIVGPKLKPVEGKHGG